MNSNTVLLAAFAVLLFLAGCGGGNNTNPYDGTWSAVYPPLSSASTITDTKTVVCSDPPASLIIKDLSGTATITATCTTTTYTISTDPTTGVVTKTADVPSYTETKYANTSITIERNPILGEKDVMKAIVNGVPHTGQCISTRACAAQSVAGDSLSLTR